MAPHPGSNETSANNDHASRTTGRTSPVASSVAALSVLMNVYLARLLRLSGGGTLIFGGRWTMSAFCVAAGVAAVAGSAGIAALAGAWATKGAGVGTSEGNEASESAAAIPGDCNSDGDGDDTRRLSDALREPLLPPLLVTVGESLAEDEESADAASAVRRRGNEDDFGGVGDKGSSTSHGPGSSGNDMESLPSSSATSHSSESSPRHNELATDLDVDEAKQLAQSDHSLAVWREGVFVVSYIVLTALSFMLGVEAVDLGNGNNTGNGSDAPAAVAIVDVVYIALSLVSLQLSYFLLKSIITKLQTSTRTVLDLRAVHVHPIRFEVERYDAYCDICSEQITDGSCFRCRLCDFDYCAACYKKGRKVQDWAVLRGDGGVKVSEGATRRAGTLAYLLRSLGLLRPYWPHVALTTVSLLVNVACRLFVPNVEGRLFDDLIGGDAASFLRGVKFLASYWAGLTVFQAVQRYSTRLISRRLRVDLRGRLFDRLLSQDIAFFDSTRTGAMARRVDGDVEDMSRPIPILVNTVVQSLVLIVGALTCCLISSIRLTVLSAACLGPVAYLTYVSAEWGGNLEGQMIACEEEGNAIITESMTNIRNVRAFSAERSESRRYGRVLARLKKKMHRDAVGDMVVEILEGTLEFLIEILVLSFGGMAIVQDHADALSIGQLIAFTLYWEMLREGLQRIQDVFADLAQSAGAAQRVFDLLDLRPDIPLEEGGEVTRQNFLGAIKFEDVQFWYHARPDKVVLDGITLEVPSGGKLALVGRSGAGKSTLVHLLLRFYDPKSGRITVDGTPLTDLNLKTFHDLIGFVSQDTHLSFGTVKENLIYGLPWTPSDEEIEDAVAAANCDFIKEMEEGYETNLGEAGVRLSGGQRQRLAIARAFLRRPRLLILDEATSHLDSENEALVQDGIDRLVESVSNPTFSLENETQRRSGCTVIIIAHRLSTVQNADVIAVINEGKVAEQGSHVHLMKHGGIYAKLVAKQKERAEDALPEGGKESAGAPVDPDVDNLFDTVMGRRDSSSCSHSYSTDGGGSSCIH